MSRELETGSVAKLLVDAADTLGEGPHWSSRDGCLYRVDIVAGCIHATTATGEGVGSAIQLGGQVGLVVPHVGGGLVAARDGDLVRLDGHAPQTLCRLEHDRPGNRLNDGKCDAAGRLWVGSLSMSGETGAGRLWRVAADGTATAVLDGLDIANGLGWSPDGRTCYVTDSGRGTIFRHAFEPATGELGERQVFARVDPADGVPDGLAVDAEGFVWTALWDGAGLRRLDPDGRLERAVALPVPRPTSCAFGGAQLSTLYITSARVGLSASALASAPLSGGVFTLDPPSPGVPVAAFGAAP